MSEHDACPPLSSELWERDLVDDDRHLAGRSLSIELERKLLRRLADSWRDLNYRHLRSRLKPPSVQLHDAESRWGAWHPGRRLITIARRQVLAYTWESVLDTLRHEMAHQLVSEVMGDPPEPPHGAAFKDACRLLQTEPTARGDGGVSLFRAGGPGPDATADDARLLRVQKLLALADDNPDEHEARVAFARASELMLRYNLDAKAAKAAAPVYVHRLLGASSGRTPHHHYSIAAILQEFFFVQCIWVDAYTVETGVRGHQLEVMGTQANVAMADYVYACLLRQSEALWEVYKRRNDVRDRRAKRQYLDGLMHGFRKQLQETSQTSAERGLIWVGDPGLDRFSRRRHPCTTTSRLDAVGASSARAAGVRDGAKMRLHKPLGGTGSTSRGRLLPG
ncbi:MAG: SprT-like domain-containing protein [Planctomycetota bacterium]